MGKKQRERKERKLEQKRTGNAPPAWLTGAMSPEARAAMDEIAKINPSRIQHEMEEAMMESGQLRQEPELQEFRFEPSHVDKVVARVLPKYEQKLKQAEAAGEQELENVYEDLTIEAIDELLPRERRQAFLRSYDQLLQRLMNGTDTKTLKRALLVRSAFDDKGFPWGAAPFFGEMFEEAKEQARGRMETAEELLEKMLKTLGDGASVKDLEALMQDPTRLEELTAAMNLTPEQQAELDEMTGDVLDEFESELYAGNVPLQLYTEQEIIESVARINQLTETIRAKDSTTQPQDLEAIARVLQERVVEIVTPERLNEIREELLLIGQRWLEEGNEDGRLLEMESDDLEGVTPAENQFLYAALIGQLRQGEEGAGEYDPDVDATVIDAESNVVDTSLDETQAQELRDRLGDMFKGKD